MGTKTERSFGDGRYVVRRQLGEGGQKVVYLVHDTQLGRECALASLKAGELSDVKLARLEREARAMARLTAHENIVTVHDIGREGVTPFMVCEYVGGGELADRLDAGPLAPDRAVAVAKDLCRALDVAHAAGVVHRDVKPANVWLTESGRAKLGDFGLALAADENRVTAEGAVVGTPYYLAPEQALTGDVDPRSDLYALGCVLYQMLTSSPPHVGTTVAQVVAKHVHAAPTPPSRVVPGVPRALDDLVLSLLAKRPDDRPASAAKVLALLDALDEPAPAAGEDTARPLDDLREASFVGRNAELDALKAALDRAVAGRGSSRTIAGEAGVGKSRLVRELSTYARLRSIPVLTGGCDAADGAPPYLPFVEALAGVAGELEPGALGAQLPILAQLLPNLPSQVDPIRGGADRYEVFRAVVSLIRLLAAPRGLVLVLEDLHWADKPSLLLLEYLAAHISDVNVLILSTYRDDEIMRSHPLAASLTKLRREREHERITLKRLGPSAAHALITALAPLSESSAEAIFEQTEGHPLFIEEVLKHLVEEGLIAEGPTNELSAHALAELGVPEGIRDVIGKRLSKLSEPCNKMLTRASALSNAIPWPLLAAICGEDEDTLLDLLDEALAAQVVRERRDDRDGAYEFTHALIRQALYEELSVPRRARLHARIGEAIELLHAGDIEPYLSELAHHFFQASAGDARDKAIDYAKRAGGRSMKRMAFEDAARHYERALSAVEDREDAVGLKTRAELHRLHGGALSVFCAWGEARDEFARGLSLLPAGHPEDRARLLLHHALSLLWTMDMPGLLRNATEALPLAKEAKRTDLEGASMGLLSVEMASAGELERSRAQYLEARALMTGTSDPLVSNTLCLGSQSLYWLGRSDETLAWVRDLGDAARAHHDGTSQMIMMPLQGLALAAEGRYREAKQVFADSATFGRDHGIRGLLARSLSMSVGSLMETFDYAGAVAQARESLELGRTHNFHPTVASSHLDLLFQEIDCGELGSADQRATTVADAVEKAVGWHQWMFALRFELARTRLAAAKADWASALDAADRTVAQARKVGRVKYEASGLAARGAALAGLGRKGEAITDLRGAVDIVRGLRYQALLLRYGGDLLALDGDDALRDEVRSCAAAIAGELDGPTLDAFQSSEWVRRV